MNIHFLWTDKCFLAVLFIGIFFLVKGLRKEHTRQACLSIFQRPLAMSASVVLLFFLSIAVLDSIHYQPQSDMPAQKHHTALLESRSLLDAILYPLGDMYEKTYSAPLSLHLFSKETSVLKEHLEQIYPRLNYAPDWLKNREDVHRFVLQVSIRSLFWSVGLTVMLWGLVAVLNKTMFTRKSQNTDTHDVVLGLKCLHTYIITMKRQFLQQFWMIMTVFICLFLTIVSYKISRELHLLGTGKIGQDIFYYAVKSIRTGLVIGILTTLFMMPLALLLGISAGFYGGVVDDVIQYIYTTLSSIPGVLLITASVLSMQTYIANHPEQFTTLAHSADARLFSLCIILGVSSWTSLCRLLRAETLKLRQMDYVMAARTLGSSSFKIIIKHLLPNVVHIVVITMVLDFSFLVLAEAVLAYVGVGVSPMTISWGNMINAARLELSREPLVWWPMLSAFSFMFVLVLASNVLSDAVRDAFDPHQAR